MSFLGLILAAIVVSVADGATNITYDLMCPRVVTSECPDNQYLTFKLYTRANPDVGQTLDLVANNIAASNFNVSNPTKIIIHGYNLNSDQPILVDLRAAYFVKGYYNVIAVDWSLLAPGAECYVEAVVNIAHVGQCIGQLIQTLRQLPVTDIHVIGHSLGAQAASYIALYVSPKVPRITALDPAGALFTPFTPLNQKLDKTDATFVDVIHTNIDISGKTGQCGHADYYLNGGTFQPGCGINPLCSHFRAVLFFTESITSTVGFYGKQCSSLAQYQLLLCSTTPTRTILMGENASSTSSGVISVPTLAASPFAKGQNN